MATEVTHAYEDYPKWRVWQSDRGRWWATRMERFTDAEEYAGCARTVDGDDLDGLREAIEEQEERRNRCCDPRPRRDSDDRADA